MPPQETIALDTAVRALLDRRDMTHCDVAAMCGMTPAWVGLFRQGRIKSPNLQAVQCLYEALTGKPLIGHR